MALYEIMAAGRDGDPEQAAFLDGQKMKGRGESRPENMKKQYKGEIL
jgi:hypothetical protein